MVNAVISTEGTVVMENLSLEFLQKIKTNIDSVPIEDIKEILGVNELKPIDGTDSVKKLVDENEDYFKEWYEDELRRRFERFIEAAIQTFK